MDEITVPLVHLAGAASQQQLHSWKSSCSWHRIAHEGGCHGSTTQAGDALYFPSRC